MDREQQTDAARSLILAGIIEAIIVAYRCQVPEQPNLTWKALFWNAVRYVVISTLAAGVGAWTWPRLRSTASPLSYWRIVLYGGPCWAFVTPIVLFYQQDSPLMLFTVSLAAVLAALCLRNLLAEKEVAAAPQLQPAAMLFSQPVYQGPGPWLAFLVAIGLYGAAAAYATGRYLGAILLSGVSVFVMAWQFLSAYRSSWNMVRAWRRMAFATVLAMLLTCIALIPWLHHVRLTPAEVEALKKSHDRSVSAAEKQANVNATAPGYQGIILWPLPPKKEVLPPVPKPSLLPGSRAAQPLVIPFNGAYWYFQSPNRSPGPQAHIAHGDPLVVNIRSTNWLPLFMEAHQSLATPLSLACCREIQVAIRNENAQPGNMALGLLLTDTLSPGKPSQYLGQHPIAPRQPAPTSTQDEVFTFAIPAAAKIRQFDQITVVILPASAWSVTGPKIAIQQFMLIPR